MTDLQTMGKKAAAVKPFLQRLSAREKNKALMHGAEMLAACGRDSFGK